MLGQLSVVEVINNNRVLAKVPINSSRSYQQIMLNDHRRKFHHFINNSRSRLANLSGGSICSFISSRMFLKFENFRRMR